MSLKHKGISTKKKQLNMNKWVLKNASEESTLRNELKPKAYLQNRNNET